MKKLESQTPESRFAELVEGYEVKTDWENHSNWLFFFKNEKLLGGFSFKTQNFYTSYKNLWKIFANEFRMEYDDIKRFMQKQIEKHFKLKKSEKLERDSTPWSWIEEHFKFKINETTGWVIIYEKEVEEHFKSKEN